MKARRARSGSGIRSKCAGALCFIALAWCASTGCSNDVHEEWHTCPDGGPWGFKNGVRRVLVGSNGTFKSECRNGRLFTYKCNIAGTIETNVTGGGGTPRDVAGDVVVDGDTFDCVDPMTPGVVGACLFGACFVPPAPDCAKAPPPCEYKAPDPRARPGEDDVCCVGPRAFSCLSLEWLAACRANPVVTWVDGGSGPVYGLPKGCDDEAPAKRLLCPQ